jgi:hypothetical protein
MSMAGQDREPEPYTAGPAANGPIGDAELIQQAQRLGQQHRAARIAPFGDADYAFWDEGSARLPGALGATSLTTGDNAPDGTGWQPPTATYSNPARPTISSPAHDGSREPRRRPRRPHAREGG